MNKTLLIVADLAGFKSYRIENDRLSRNPRLEPVEQFVNPGAHTRVVDMVTDLAGRFRKSVGSSASTGAMSDGENHNLDLEWRKRLVRRLASRMNSILQNPGVTRCLMAASLEIHRPLLDMLNATARAKIERTLSADLMKTPRADLLRHFSPPMRTAALQMPRSVVR